MISSYRPDEVSASRTSGPSNPEMDEISLGEIWAALMTGRLMILSVTFVFGAIAAAIALNTKPIYRAEVLIAVANDTGVQGGLSALAGQFGGLASLAGVNLGGGGNKGEAVATMSSRALTEAYINQQDLLPILFAKRWDVAKGIFVPDAKGKTPTAWDGNNLFAKQIRRIVEDKKTGLVTLAIEWEDPARAAQWANDIVRLTNQTLRDRAIANSNHNLVYLNEQLEKSSVVELRQAIFNLIETEVKNVMVAQGSQEYVFKVIDPAVVPQQKAKPNRSLIVAVGLLLGFIFSSLYALAKGSAKRGSPA